jgi:hypothetical protein
MSGFVLGMRAGAIFGVWKLVALHCPSD